jgi:hypothetical protein
MGMTWEQLTATPVLLATIGVLSAAIIVPLAKKYLFDPRTRLVVEVRVVAHPKSMALQKLTQEALKMNFTHPMWDLVRAKGCVLVNIKNVSKKKISGVTVGLPDLVSAMVCQVDEAEEPIGDKVMKIVPIGDIQPGHVRSLYIWTGNDMSDFDFSFIKKLFHVSADELDAVRFRFPMPRYILGKYAEYAKFVFLTIAVLFCLMMIAGQLGVAIKT